MKKEKTQDQFLKLTYVYLIGEHENGPIKIGVAGSVPSRLQTLQVGNPRKLKCYGSRPFITEKDAFDFEAKLHKLFSKQSIRGEWFASTISAIKEKVLLTYGPPDSPTELIERAITRGIISYPDSSI